MAAGKRVLIGKMANGLQPRGLIMESIFEFHPEPRRHAEPAASASSPRHDRRWRRAGWPTDVLIVGIGARTSSRRRLPARDHRPGPAAHILVQELPRTRVLHPPRHGLHHARSRRLPGLRAASSSTPPRTVHILMEGGRWRASVPWRTSWRVCVRSASTSSPSPAATLTTSGSRNANGTAAPTCFAPAGVVGYARNDHNRATRPARLRVLRPPTIAGRADPSSTRGASSRAVRAGGAGAAAHDAADRAPRIPAAALWG
jgi:hypothetical protein